jgi:hypothetical protein
MVTRRSAAGHRLTRPDGPDLRCGQRQRACSAARSRRSSARGGMVTRWKPVGHRLTRLDGPGLDVDSGGELAVLRGHDDGVWGWCGQGTVGGWPPRHTTGRSGSGIRGVIASSRRCTATMMGFAKWRGHQIDAGWPPRHVIGRPGSGTLTAAVSSQCCAATTRRFGGWRGHRIVSGWLPHQATEQSGSGGESGAEVIVVGAHTGESRACRGLRTANESPLFRVTGPAGSGMRRSASRILWPTPTAASPRN